MVKMSMRVESRMPFLVVEQGVELAVRSAM